MTSEPATGRGEVHSPAWWKGYRQGLADRESGAMTLICGGSQAAMDESAGYIAARYSGPVLDEARPRERAGREAEAG